MIQSCFLGVDAGGTSTRALVADSEGRRLGVGKSGGSNPVSHGREAALANMTEAVTTALSGTDPTRIAGAVIGLAGVSSRHNSDHIFTPLWTDLGLGCQVRMWSDALVAFASGTPEPTGTVLVAGTGAAAIGVNDHGFSRRRSDGFGWLLGDLGSGFWLGQQAARAALRYAAGIEPTGMLVENVIAEVAPGNPANVETLIGEITQWEPVTLSRLAPLVTAAADSGDRCAVDITSEAVKHLRSTAADVRDAHDDSAIVVAGSLLSNDNLIAREVRQALATDYPHAGIHTAHDGAAGAAWLALRETVDADTARDWHHRVLGVA